MRVWIALVEYAHSLLAVRLVSMRLVPHKVFTCYVINPKKHYYPFPPLLSR